MTGVIDSATAIMGSAERRLEIVAANVANLATPGYKVVRWSDERSAPATSYSATAEHVRVRLDQGKLESTGRGLDLAISGEALFQVRVGQSLLYTRQGQFSLSSDGTGTLVTPQGYVLQQAGGGDIQLEGATVSVLADGTIMDSDRPVAKIGLFGVDHVSEIVPVDGALFAVSGSAVHEDVTAQVRQGMLEASTVSTGSEMVEMMTLLRHSDTGARLVQVYDDLVGRAITTFGQTGR